MIPLCNIILQKPKHGYNPDEMKIKGPQHAKVDGDIKQGEGDTRKDANLEQNSKIIDKCLYRKALALLKLGEGKESIKCL